MPEIFEAEEPQVVARFIRALATGMLSIVGLLITIAMFWKECALPSVFDRWFGTWSDGALTLLTAGLDLTSVVAIRAVQKSEARYRSRSIRR